MLHISTYIHLCIQDISVFVLGGGGMKKTVIVVLWYMHQHVGTGDGSSKEDGNWFTVAHQYTHTHTHTHAHTHTRTTTHICTQAHCTATVLEGKRWVLRAD